MSFGGNFSSGQTAKLQECVQTHSTPVAQAANCEACVSPSSGYAASAVYSSRLLASKVCPPISPEDFALYPKVAVPSSMRTLNLILQKKCDPSQRFAQYQRYTPPVPCQALPQVQAGISLPSTRPCNL